jgi:hypothetical protein
VPLLVERANLKRSLGFASPGRSFTAFSLLKIEMELNNESLLLLKIGMAVPLGMAVFNESVTCGIEMWRLPGRFHAARRMSYGLRTRIRSTAPRAPVAEFRTSALQSDGVHSYFYFLLITVLIATIGREGADPTGRLAFFLAQ